MLVAVLKCLVHCCWTVCFLLMMSGPVYRHLDQLYVSRRLRLIKVPLCLTHLITPFLFPAATVLSLFSFFECLVKLQNPDVKPLFSTSSLSISQISLPLFRPLFYIISVSLPLFFSSALRLIHLVACRDVSAQAGAPCLCVQACSMYLHTSFDDCRSTSFLQFLCLDGPGEMIQYWGPHGSASSDVINYTSEPI